MSIAKSLFLAGLALQIVIKWGLSIYSVIGYWEDSGYIDVGITTHHLSCEGCMVQYDTWGKIRSKLLRRG